MTVSDSKPSPLTNQAIMKELFLWFMMYGKDTTMRFAEIEWTEFPLIHSTNENYDPSPIVYMSKKGIDKGDLQHTPIRWMIRPQTYEILLWWMKREEDKART